MEKCFPYDKLFNYHFYFDKYDKSTFLSIHLNISTMITNELRI